MNKTFGCTLMITGTSIGGGMLALPVVTASTGFFLSCLLLITGWFFMTVGALFVLEVNLWLRENNNLFSMSKVTLGKLGQLVTSISYCSLLYAALCAFTSGSSDLLKQFFITLYFPLPPLLYHLITVLLLGTITWFGTRWIDYANRGLMTLKLLSLLLLIVLLTPHGSMHRLPSNHISRTPEAFMVIALSFTYSIVIPSMRVYLKSNIKQLRFAILIGSLIPLVCYLIWIYTIQSVIPSHGGNSSLTAIAQQGGVVGALTHRLSNVINSPLLSSTTHLFTSICMLTAFLAVSLSLSDFLADAFNLKKVGRQKWTIFGMTFIPVLIILTFTPHIFISALSVGGIFCVILVMVLPALMVWHGRYHKPIKTCPVFRVKGGKILILFQLIAGLALIATDLIYRFSSHH